MTERVVKQDPTVLWIAIFSPKLRNLLLLHGAADELRNLFSESLFPTSPKTGEKWGTHKRERAIARIVEPFQVLAGNILK